MKSKAYLLVFDGLADWEPAHAFCEIRRSGKFEILTAGFSRDSVISMAGLRITPDVRVDEVHAADMAFFMLPGGDMWEKESQPSIHALLRQLHEDEVLIGAICAATLEVARAGLTKGLYHTSNTKSYLKAMVPGYQDEDYYVDQRAVTDRNIITASGLGSVEFAREVMRELKLYGDADAAIWFEMYKHGVMPPGML